MMRMLTVGCALLLVACANPINQRTAENYYDWGLRAENAGDFALAERNYERALINARLAHSPDAWISAAMYSVGRMKGIRCKFDEAEPLLLESLKLEETVTGPESAITSKRIFELARFYSDREMYARSLPYFSRGIPLLFKLGVESSDPMALADTLDTYSIALLKSGQSSESERVKLQAEEIRSKNKGKAAIFVPVRYGSRCSTT
jgi:tetratricopeptide (TPR) repeat protein